MSRRTVPVDRLTGISVHTDSSPLGPAESSPADRLLACADLLACPECAAPLTAESRTLRCTRGHAFDLAKQGYVSLLTGAATKMTGDTPAMLDARAAFQSAGHFTPIAEALATAVFGAIAASAALRTTPDAAARPTTPSPKPVPSRPRGPIPGIIAPGSSVAAASAAWLATTILAADTATRGHGGRSKQPPVMPGATADSAAPAGASGIGYENDAVMSAEMGTDTRGVRTVLEIGAGTGYYLAAILDAMPGARGVALDVSKAAARRAARSHGRAGSVLADAWRGLPVRDGVADVVVCVFAPRNAEEVARVLTPDGRFVVVTPTSRHLRELIGPLEMVSVDEAKEDRLAQSLAARFEFVERSAVEYSMSLTHEDVANVVAMGPSAFHAAQERTEAIAALPDPMPVTASVTVSVYRPRRVPA